MNLQEFKFKRNGKKNTVIIEPDSDSDTNSELDDNTEDGVSNTQFSNTRNTICSFDHCIVNETSNAQCQDPIHLNIHNELYENNDDDDDDIASHSDNELMPGRDTPYSPPLSDDDDIASHSDNELVPGRDTPYSPPLSDDDDIASHSDNELMPGRDTPYSLPLSEKIKEYDSDATDNDLDGQGPEIIPCTQGQEQYNISYLCRNETFSSAEDDEACR